MRPFFSQLERLQGEITKMSELVRSNISKSVRCLTESNPDYADQVYRDEVLINQFEIAIDDMATRLVALNAPVASDMRLLIAALKINTDLERMGDLAMGIARRSLSLLGQQPIDVPVVPMSELVEKMVDDCITSFTHRDEQLARTVLTADDEVDRMRNQLNEDLLNRMEQEAGLVRRGLLYMYITRNLERIADHATNIAEDVIFVIKGIDVRHHNDLLPGER